MGALKSKSDQSSNSSSNSNFFSRIYPAKNFTPVGTLELIFFTQQIANSTFGNYPQEIVRHIAFFHYCVNCQPVTAQNALTITIEGLTKTQPANITVLSENRNGEVELLLSEYSINCVSKLTLNRGRFVKHEIICGSTQGNEVGKNSKFNMPLAVTVDPYGDYLISDCYNNQIKKYNPSTGEVERYAGSSQGTTDGTLSQALFYNPADILIKNKNELYVVDSGNSLIRHIENGVVSTLKLPSPLGQPRCGCLDSKGNLYLADYGSGTIQVIYDIEGTSCKQKALEGVTFSHPFGICFDGEENLIVSDWTNSSLNKVDMKTKEVTVLASGLQGPCGICIDRQGSIYIAEYSGNRVRMVVNKDVFKLLSQ